MKGNLKGDSAINMLCQLKENRDFEYALDNDQGQYLFQRACLEAFTESNDPKLKDPKVQPLGAFAESLVLILTREDLPFLENDI
jgi:hypothetical protein